MDHGDRRDGRDGRDGRDRRDGGGSPRRPEPERRAAQLPDLERPTPQWTDPQGSDLQASQASDPQRPDLRSSAARPDREPGQQRPGPDRDGATGTSQDEAARTGAEPDDGGAVGRHRAERDQAGRDGEPRRREKRRRRRRRKRRPAQTEARQERADLHAPRDLPGERDVQPAEDLRAESDVQAARDLRAERDLRYAGKATPDERPKVGPEDATVEPREAPERTAEEGRPVRRRRPHRRAARRQARRHRAVERRAIFAALAGSALFALLLVLVVTEWVPLLDVDRAVLADMPALVPPGSVAATFFVVVQAISQPWVLRGATVVVAALVIRSGYRRLGLWLVGTVAVGALLETFLKALVARPRPAPPDAITHVGGYAFPSGHAFTSALVVCALLIVAGRLGVRRRTQVVLSCVAGVVVLLVGFDRVALSVHYVSDVISGWMLAPALLGATVLAFGLGRPRTPAERDDGERPRRVAVILNPSKVDDEADFRRQVERHAARTGWDPPHWFETTIDDPGRALTRAALNDGVELVIAAGGDGTVRVVCAELAGTGVPVGIVPAGTGNLLVRNLGLPLDLQEAIEVAFTGVDRRLDLVRVEGDHLEPDRFAVMAGLGLDAAVVGEAPPKLKARVGWAAYGVSVVRNLSFPAVRVDITVDDQPPVRRWVRTVLVGNVGTLHGGLSLLPDAEPDDGMIDVVAVAPRRLTDWPQLAWRVLRRSPAQDERLRTWRGKKVVVRAGDACPRQLDGDVIELGQELRCEVEPGVLLIRMPKNGSDQS